MEICKGCGEPTVDPQGPARYDVLNPDADLDNPAASGPYGPECWHQTVTGARERMPFHPNLSLDPELYESTLPSAHASSAEN